MENLSWVNLATWWNENYVPIVGKAFTISESLANMLSLVKINSAELQVAAAQFSVPIPAEGGGWTTHDFDLGFAFALDVTIFNTLNVKAAAALPPPDTFPLTNFDVNAALNAANIGFSASGFVEGVSFNVSQLFDMLADALGDAEISIPADSLGMGGVTTLSHLLSFANVTVNPKQLLEGVVRGGASSLAGTATVVRFEFLRL